MGRFAWSTLSILIAGMAPALGQAPAQAPADDAALCRTTSGDAAIAACTRAIAGGKLKDRNLAVAYNKRGSEEERKGEPDKAIVDYDEALRADPTFVVVYVNRAQVFRRRRELDRAIADYTDALKVNPAYAFAYNGRGNIFNDKADYDRAIADFDEAIRLDPRMAVAYSNRAWSYRNKNDYNRAIADYDTAIRLDPRSHQFYNRGQALRTKGDMDRAIADYDEAVRLDVNTLSPIATAAAPIRQGGFRSRHSQSQRGDPPRPERCPCLRGPRPVEALKGDLARAEPPRRWG